MKFELTKEFISDLSDAAASGNSTFISSSLVDLHPADIAEILEEFDFEEAKIIYGHLEEEMASDVLTELDEDTREEFLASFSAKEIAESLDNMDSDDATDVIQDLPEHRKERVISELEDEEQASDIVDLLTYEENTAGGLMAKEFITVNENWTVEHAILEMRKQAEDVEQVYTIYVLSDKNVLIGTLSLKSILFAEDKTLINMLYSGEVRSVKATVESEEVVAIMDKYDLVALPVVNDEDVLLGRITIDDVVDVMREEAEKDYQMASGISEKVESSDSVWMLSRARLPWLLIGLLGGLLGAQVITGFEEKLGQFPVVASFIPVILAMGGNVGVQSSAIIVQALAQNTLGLESTGMKLLKELVVAIINGLICSLLLVAYTLLMHQDIMLAVTMIISLMSVFVYAGLFGTIVPLVLNKYKIDPALATGPFITTANDVFGLLLYFLIGWSLYF
ncbi:MAG: magnesium transporter [Crocinitomicaceae bacterium]|nr:magnesium transporter [Crocinitomicaceae bacterium]MBT6515479.1 magnesium transporter [Crocinitomicaceae bacterium]